MKQPEYRIQLADVMGIPSDLLLLKHAQEFYGADQVVATRLISSGLCSESDLRPKPGNFAIVETNGIIAPARVMFLGTKPLSEFHYDEMQRFAERFVEALT